MQRKPRPTLPPEELEALRNTTLATIAELAPPDTPAIISTETLAQIAGIRPASIRSSVWRKGHWLGLTPLRLGQVCRWKVRG